MNRAVAWLGGGAAAVLLAVGFLGVWADAGPIQDADADTVVSAPTISKVTPTQMSFLTTGGITIAGSDFQDGATVLLNGGPPTTTTVVSDTEITTSLTYAGGVLPSPPVTVTVTNPDGGTVTAENAIGPCSAAVRITGLFPATGSPQGGDSVTVVGWSGMGDTVAIGFGANNAESFTVTSDTTVQVVTPPGPLGAANVWVQTECDRYTLYNGFIYVAPPSAAPSD